MNLANIEYQDKIRQYVLQMRPVFKPNAFFSEETEKYRECIGMVNQSLAELADIVTEVVYGIPVCIRKEQKKYEEYKKNME